MSRPSWDEVLESFATRLDDQRAALEAGEVDAVPPFAPPPSIGPFPARLRCRAEGLLQEAAELQAEMAARLASTTREVQAVRRFLATAGRPVAAAYVDESL